MSEDDGGCGGAGKSRNSGEYFTPYPDQVLENVLENVLVFLKSRRDRNAVSLVCKSWYRAEAYTRSDLFIGNCYAVAPRRVTDRFKRVRSVSVKGKPRFADFSLLPPDWGAHFRPWVSAMATAYRALEKIYLKRMSITDDDLAVIAHSFPNFKELVLVCCEDFGTSGLAVVVSECRSLRVLELIEDDVSDDEVDWISCFPPEGTTNLESLSFDCVESPINFEALERLVARSPLLKKLRLNRHVSIGQLQRLIFRSPQLTHLGTGSFAPLEIAGQQQVDNREPDYGSAFAACRSIVCLSGFREISPEHLPAIFPVSANLTSLNLSYANIDADQLRPVIRHCHKLQALDSICDEGLQMVADSCKDLRELRIFPIDGSENIEGPVSEVGLLAISIGCRKLQSVLYFCQQMTNAAVIAMSKNCPDLVVFRLCIIDRYRPDHVTGEPMDEGFGAIVKNCKKLTRLAVSGLLTDRAFSYIGQYGKLVRTLSVAFNGESDIGLKYILEGCTNLQKLEIRDSPFGDSALWSGLHHFYNMRFVWMSSCRVTRQGCTNVARQLPRLVVEVFRGDGVEGGERGDFMDTLYMYRSLDGPRTDAPQFVKIL
ncbi:F-box domain, cyclin-like protein [Cynara cardunculus var. scolymus]|uniref:F-box domain, cyclin-like protein n=1 Tax=Cynara cardunculus var. scolymus TaxID=59895 RepID=A0A103XXS7_CYNCS|nr:F-box domain, cyclin-like protein [Cynara cardunculus var. scolymus]